MQTTWHDCAAEEEDGRHQRGRKSTCIEGIPAEPMNIGGSITWMGRIYDDSRSPFHRGFEEEGMAFTAHRRGVRYHDGRHHLYHAAIRRSSPICSLSGTSTAGCALLPIGGRYTMGPEEAIGRSPVRGGAARDPDALRHLPLPSSKTSGSSSRPSTRRHRSVRVLSPG